MKESNKKRNRRVASLLTAVMVLAGFPTGTFAQSVTEEDFVLYEEAYPEMLGGTEVSSTEKNTETEATTETETEVPEDPSADKEGSDDAEDVDKPEEDKPGQSETKVGDVTVYDSTGEPIFAYNVVDAKDPANNAAIIDAAFEEIKKYHDNALAASQKAAEEGDAKEEAKQRAKSTEILTVKVNAGNYYSKEALNIYSYTTLDLTSGAHLIRSKVTASGAENTSTLLRFGKSGETNYGYEGFKDISIIGGTADMDSASYGTLDGGGTTHSIFRFAHATNVKVQYVHFTNVTRMHHLEFAASQYVTFDHCLFDGYTNGGSTTFDTNAEALSLDTLVSGNFGSFKAYDHTVNQHVYITNNVFKDCKCGIGTHRGEVGRYFSDIVIANNYFDNMERYAVMGTNYKDCTIDGNVITNSGSGIWIRHMMDSKGYYNVITDGTVDTTVTTNLNTAITNNSISLAKKAYAFSSANKARTMYGISVYGEYVPYNITTKNEDTGNVVTIPAGDYRVTGVNVSGNTIAASFPVMGIWMRGAFNNVIANNNISYAMAEKASRTTDAIRLQNTDNIQISGNTVTELSGALATTNNGIYLQQNCLNTLVQGNVISGVKKNGIYVASASVATMLSNMITGTGSDGIYAYASTVIMNHNLIGSVGDDAICVAGKSIVPEIVGNVITAPADNGIYINGSSSVTNLSQNKLYDITGYGIYNSVSAIGNINLNVIAPSYNKKSSKNGILVTGDGAYVGAIDQNTIKAATTYGISITQNAKVKKITTNKIQNSGTIALNITSTAQKVQIEGNTIKKATEYGINLANGMKGTIKGNTIKKCTKGQIYVMPKDEDGTGKLINTAKLKITSAKGGATAVTLNWKSYKNVKSYEVYRSTKKTKNFKKLATVKTNTYVDKTAKKGKTYYYKIVPYSKIGKLKVYGTETAVKKGSR